jgi:hypothetical protein
MVDSEEIRMALEHRKKVERVKECREKATNWIEFKKCMLEMKD